MALVERVQNISFPKDHNTHDTPVEWWYFWGKFSSGEFFHLATFRAGMKKIQARATHWSLHNGNCQYFEELADDFNYLNYGSTFIRWRNSWSIEAKDFYLNLFPDCKAFSHKTLPHRNYYSMPWMKAKGIFKPDKEIESNVWMDHEFSEGKEFSNWDWVGVKLDCGVAIMAFDSETDKNCSVMIGDKAIRSDFILEGKHLFVHSLGIYLILEPLEQEQIFDPKFGIKYSEVPFNVISKGGIIGYGMRERTYHKEKENG